MRTSTVKRKSLNLYLLNFSLEIQKSIYLSFLERWGLFFFVFFIKSILMKEEFEEMKGKNGDSTKF